MTFIYLFIYFLYGLRMREVGAAHTFTQAADCEHKAFIFLPPNSPKLKLTLGKDSTKYQDQKHFNQVTRHVKSTLYKRNKTGTFTWGNIQ